MSDESNITKSRRFACATCGEEYVDIEALNCPFDGTRLTPLAEELAAGSVLAGRYEILEAVSGGAMGRVYKAKHKLMKRKVAIKTMLSNLVASGSAVKRFQQEAEALSTLSHPNILSVFDFFIGDDGQPYMVMDFLEGTNLEQERIAHGAMPATRVGHIFRQVCDALAAAHDAEIIHRDVKPSNIMLVRVGVDPDFVKVIDFGIAKMFSPNEDSGVSLTATGDTFGTPQYMSPEQCRAKKPDARSDIYSLGCVMYTAIAGKPAFSADDPMQCMFMHVNEPPPEFAPELNCPPELKQVVFKAMAKDPADRFQSMEEMKAAIVSSVAEPQAVTEYSLKSYTPGAVLGLSPKVMPVGVAVIGLLAVTVGFSVVTHNQSQPTPRPGSYADRVPRFNTTNSQEASTAPITPGVTTAPPVATEVAVPPTAAAQLTPAQQYDQELALGQKAFTVDDMDEAQAHFNEAHRLAPFGSAHYLDTLEWQGKVAFKKGDLADAKQAMVYVINGLKSRGDSKSARFKETQHQLRLIEAAIKSR